MCKKSLCMIALAAVLTLNCTTSYAWKTVYDPTNYKANLETKVQAIKQVKQQAEQIKHELANLSKLNPSQSNASVSKVRELIKTMNKLRAETNAIGTDYREMMEQFDQLRPDYERWNGVSAEEYAKQNDKFRESWEQSIEQSMKVQGIVSPEEQQKTADHLERLINASQSAEGAMGALQAANQISALQILELQKMEAVMADSMRTQNLYYQSKIDAELQSKKISKDFIKGSEKYKNSRFEGGNSTIGHY